MTRVDGNDDLKFLERGILLEDFYEVRCKRKYDMEFRVLQRMTQHKDHVKNLYTSAKMEFKRQNRYNEVLPCKSMPLYQTSVNHSRVKLQNKTAAPLQIAGSSAEDEPMIPITSSNFDIDFKDESKMSDTERYMNANYINVIILNNL